MYHYYVPLCTHEKKKTSFSKKDIHLKQMNSFRSRGFPRLAPDLVTNPIPQNWATGPLRHGIEFHEKIIDQWWIFQLKPCLITRGYTDS